MAFRSSFAANRAFAIRQASKQANPNKAYILRKDTFWAIVSDKQEGGRVVYHTGKPDYIRKIWAERFAAK